MSAQEKNYPENCWWVVAKSDEVSEKPLGRWILDKPVVLYRGSSGALIALEDRCPHRWAPLSHGGVLGDTIVCAYHGFRFGADGKCSLIPTQEKIPEKVRVQAYPIEEVDGYIWIWLGDPAKASAAKIPQLSFLSGPGWHGVSGYMEVNANYFMLQENVLDLTHFGFLHAGSLDQEGWDAAGSDVTVENGQVSYRKAIQQEPIAPFLGLPLGYTLDQKADRIDWGTFVLPGVHIAGVELQDPVATGTTRRFRITHLTTPQSVDRTHYWWALAYDYGSDDPDISRTVQELIAVVFAQDKEMVEAIQEIVTRDARHANSNEVSILSDRPGLQARKITQEMLVAERPSSDFAHPTLV